MKKLMNYSKLVIPTLIASSLFVACSEEISETTCDTQYTANTSSIKTAGQAVDLGLPSGTKWANMNVGATSESDNGILFVWGDVTGTQVLASNLTSYTDVTEPTSVSKLFDMYKNAAESIGEIPDTTNISKLSEPKLIDLSGIGETPKRDAIISFVQAKFNDLVSQSYTGLLEASLTNDEFECIFDWDGSKLIERLPKLKDVMKLDKDPTFQDTLDYYQTFDDALLTTLVIDQIGSTEAKYYASALANNSAEIKDKFGEVMRKDYTGGDIGNAPKDRHDEKKRNSLTFVPAYSIISDANHDPATANWGGKWRMPSTADFVELLVYCDWEFTGNGYKVTSKAEGNKNSIFLPAAGYRYGNQWYGNGNAGYYATGEITGVYHFPSMAEQVNGSKGEVTGAENMPNMLIFQHGLYNSLDIYNNLSSSFGISIRPVTD